MAAIRLHIAFLLLALALACAPRFAGAQFVNCSATMTNAMFGNVNPLSSQTDTTATLNYTCTNSTT